ncbi:MAG: gluconate 2-dehydrogenase subunit 3 family protein [Pedobacter sp.]|nr:MAG: gluconate 2-dehydrogenase subunit 3 family protein [Pedobacter sp.]
MIFINMTRKEALNRVALILGGVVIGAEVWLSGCRQQPLASQLFDERNLGLLNEIADTILPRTKTPGAKDADVAPVIALIVNDCYSQINQQTFLDGLDKLNRDFNDEFDRDFKDGKTGDRLQFMKDFQRREKAFAASDQKKDSPRFFGMMMQLTLLSYFTSEEGCTKTMRYVPVPGKFIGDYPYERGDRAWALG